MLSRRGWLISLPALRLLFPFKAQSQGNIVQIFCDGNYGGCSYSSVTSMNRVPNNDTMSSFHLAKGYSVIFYVDVDYQGEMFRCPSNDYPNIDNPTVRPQDNDKMSSFRLFGDLYFQKQI